MSDSIAPMQRVPKYMPIRDALAHQIESGQLQSHQKLPSERVLSESLNTTRVAVREALLMLEMEGLIYRLDRRGWFVRSPRIIYNPQSTKSFNQYVTEQGAVPSTVLLSSQRLAATTWDAQHLDIEVSEEIYSVWRKRSINARPVMVEHLRIKAHLFPDLLNYDLSQSMTQLLAEHYDRHLTRAHIHLYPAALAEQHAKMLHVNVGSMGLYISRTNRDQSGIITDVNQEYWLHDILDLHFEAH